MSTAPIDRTLYAVPAPPQQERFALLLRLKRTARRALDTLLALPRGAAGWVLRQARTVLSAIGSNPVLERLGARLSGLGDLIRSVGPIPATAAVLSIPAVWRATVRAARFLGSKIAAGASTLWQQTRSLLGKLGPDRHPHRRRASPTPAPWSADCSSGSPSTRSPRPSPGAWPPSLAWSGRSARASSSTGSWACSSAPRGCAGPSSCWRCRWSSLPASSSTSAPDCALPPSPCARRRRDRPAPGIAECGRRRRHEPTVDGQESEIRVVPDESDDWAAAFEPRNRAERRAQQQAQTHAKRARARH